MFRVNPLCRLVSACLVCECTARPKVHVKEQPVSIFLYNKIKKYIKNFSRLLTLHHVSLNHRIAPDDIPSCRIPNTRGPWPRHCQRQCTAETIKSADQLKAKQPGSSSWRGWKDGIRHQSETGLIREGPLLEA